MWGPYVYIPVLDMFTWEQRSMKTSIVNAHFDHICWTYITYAFLNIYSVVFISELPCPCNLALEGMKK